MDMAKDGTRKPARRRGWRWFFVTFKWCRISILLLVLVVIVLGLFLNHVGLPEAVERRVLTRIQEQGWDVSFSRLRLRWFHGIVAEDLQLHRTNGIAGPNLFIRSAEFRPNWKSLRRLRFESEGVALKEGRLIWPVRATNQHERAFVFNQLGGELLFLPGDVWELKFLEGTFLGARAHFRGEMTNASFIRAWKFARPERPPGATPPAEAWHRLLRNLERVRLTGTPITQVIIQGNAQDWRSFDVTVKVTAVAVDSPWGGATNVVFTAHSLPALTRSDPLRVSLQVGADQAATPWGRAQHLQLGLQVEPSLETYFPTNVRVAIQVKDTVTEWGRAERLSIEARSQPQGAGGQARRTRLEVAGDQIESAWGRARHLDLSGTLRHPGTNYLPANVEGSFTTEGLETRWLTSQWASVTATAELPERSQFHLTQTNAAWPARINNLPFVMTASLSNAIAGGHVFDRVRTDVQWQDPEGEVHANVLSPDGAIAARARVNARSGLIAFTNFTTVNPSKFSHYLSTNAQGALADLTIRSSPRLMAKGSFIVPSWTNWPPDWPRDVSPTLAMDGQLDAADGSFRGVEFTGVRVPFSVTNQIWTLVDVRLGRTEGDLQLSAWADENTAQFVLDVDSQVNPTALAPAFPKAATVLEMFEFTSPPPHLQAQLSGNWKDWSRLAGTSDVLLTNLTFRGVPVRGCTTRVTYSNQWLSVLEPVVIREGERGRADGIGIDLKQMRLHLTNATGRMSAQAITRAIGPLPERAIAPYIFEVPPDARAEGSIPLRRSAGKEDLRFHVDGGRFHWNVLHFERMKGFIWWQGDQLLLTNIQGRWHGGDIAGWANFDFAAPHGGSMAFSADIQNNSLRPIITDFQQGKSNKLEGLISGSLRVTRADVIDLNSWNGYGNVQLQEGLIWDIPLFGFVSPILNAVFPGLGSSRAKEGSATFTLTNSVVHSEDLEIVANATRLRYRGRVGFDGYVDARMEAELMREVPAVGVVISKIFWPVTKLFAYRVTGTLEDPKPEPVYVLPRIILLPLAPFKVLKEILTPPVKRPDEEPAAPTAPPPPPAPQPKP